jgi:hypothetical protein
MHLLRPNVTPSEHSYLRTLKPAALERPVFTCFGHLARFAGVVRLEHRADEKDGPLCPRAARGRARLPIMAIPNPRLDKRLNGEYLYRQRGNGYARGHCV